MGLSITYILIGLVLLGFGADMLVRGSAALAIRLGVTALAAGLTVVAFGTGSPEFVVCVQAARAGNSGIALGNVLGSNIANIALVLGIAAVVRPLTVRSQLIRREMPMMIGITLVLCAMLFDGQLSRIDGGILVVAAVAYTVFTYVAAKRGESVVVVEEYEESIPTPTRSWMIELALATAGLVGLVIGANLLLKGSVDVATRIGVSHIVVGLSVAAIGTSLPELAASVAATLRREPDVAFGNAIGSNIVNILAVLGAAALINPIQTTGLRSIDLGVVVGSAIILLPLMWRGSVLNRWEGAALVAAYAIYVSSLGW